MRIPLRPSRQQAAQQRMELLGQTTQEDATMRSLFQRAASAAQLLLLALAASTALIITADLLSGQAGTKVPVNTWTVFTTSGGYPVSFTAFDSTVYAPAIKRHLIRGNYKLIGSEPNLALWGW